MQSGTERRGISLVIAGLVAGAGAVLLLVGLFVVLRPSSAAPGGGTSSATPSAPAAAVAPSASASAEPGSSTDGAAGSTEIPTSPSGAALLVGAGDIGRCDSTADDDTAALVERLPGAVFTLGDNAYDLGSKSNYAECLDPSWGRFKDRIRIAVPGNHDYGTKDASGYRDYFGATAVRDGETWYSQEAGAWHVIVLDSDCDNVSGGCGPDSPQVRWLRDDLAAHTARCTMALFHHPRFSSGEHGNDDAVAPFWDALYAAGADLILNGHEHSYERFGPQDPAGHADDARGIVEIIAGTGGASLRGFHDPEPNSRVRSAIAHGVISLSLEASSWTWTFTSTDGSFSDSGAGTCH
jgi:3',5'-cyclic AMP phosphodiesterase CpdA